MTYNLENLNIKPKNIHKVVYFNALKKKQRSFSERIESRTKQHQN